MPPPAPTTKAPLKILLVRNENQGQRVRSLMADESTLYWRSSDPQKDLETALGEEHFDLIIADYRETKTDVLGAVESLRKRQPEAQIILICKKLELEEIIRAIRLGVRDVFNPPLDFKSLAGRIESLVRSGDKFPGTIEETALGRWGELAMHLSGAPEEEPAPAAKASGRRGAAATGNELQLDAVVQERDNLANEVKTLKKTLAGTEEAQHRLQEELAWTTTLSEHAKSLDQEVQQLRQEQDAWMAETKRRGETEQALAAEKRRVEELQAALAQQTQNLTAKEENLVTEQTEQLDVERAVIEQQRRALDKQQAALQEEQARLEAADKSRARENVERERALAAREKANQEQIALLNAAREKVEAEQALAGQAAAKAEGAQRATRQALERDQASLVAEKTRLDQENSRLAAEVGAQQQRAVAAEGELKTEKARLEKLQVELAQQAKSNLAKAERLTAEQAEQLEVERMMHEQQRQALAKQQATLQEEAKRIDLAGKNLAQETARREQALLAQEKAQKEESDRLAADRAGRPGRACGST